MNRRAFYTSLLMKWVENPAWALEPWMVADYRLIPQEKLFEQLTEEGLSFDTKSFIAQADAFDSPEEFSEQLLKDISDELLQDRLYLLIFELWRRLMPQKLAVSLFCDELDYQIYLYDSGRTESAEDLEDALANLQVLLVENADRGEDPVEMFASFSNQCANDIEGFLYDFTAEQIKSQNFSYALELLDGFVQFVEDPKWFDLLHVRVLAYTDQEAARILLEQIVIVISEERDLSFNLEFLEFLAEMELCDQFMAVLEASLPLIEMEDDFQELISICLLFYEQLKKEDVHHALLEILNKRSQFDVESTLKKDDVDFSRFLTLVQSA